MPNDTSIINTSHRCSGRERVSWYAELLIRRTFSYGRLHGVTIAVVSNKRNISSAEIIRRFLLFLQDIYYLCVNISLKMIYMNRIFKVLSLASMLLISVQPSAQGQNIYSGSAARKERNRQPSSIRCSTASRMQRDWSKIPPKLILLAVMTIATMTCDSIWARLSASFTVAARR